MHHKTNYATVKEAIDELRTKGYWVDFNLREKSIVSEKGKYSPDDLEIVEIYYYEGESNPDDEATVYGIRANSGEKGTLVVGSQSSIGANKAELIQKIKIMSENSN